MKREKTTRIQALESLRFILALIVMQSHLRIADWSFKYFYNGNLVVVFFFMLSGFGLAYGSYHDSGQCEINSKWSLIGEYKRVFIKMKSMYFWYILFIIISLPWQFYDLVTWHNVEYAFVGTLATILITPTMLQSLLGFYQASHLGLGAYWFVSTLFILKLFYPLLYRINIRLMKNRSVRLILVLTTVIFIISLVIWDVLHFISQNTMLNDMDYGSPLTCVFYFIIGILFCDLYILCKDGNKNLTLTVVEIVVVIAFIIWCLGRNSFLSMADQWKHVIDVSICMGILGTFMFNRGGVSRGVLQSKLLLKLNKYSMYVYLGHYVLATHIRGFLDIMFDLDEIRANIMQKILVMTLLIPLCYYMRKCDLKQAIKG